MTELEWLKQEAGLTDAEWTAMSAVGGSEKLVAGIKKAMGLSSQAIADKTAAESERIALENRYQNEFIPEMRKVTQDSLRAQGDAAAAHAALKAAREYGIVPEEPVKPIAEVRAPGSPNPTTSNFDEATFRAQQSRAIITLNDLNAEHFKLFSAPLGNSQELVDMVQREHTLGRRDYTLQNAWEMKYNVPAKREEITAAARQKDIDTAVAAKLKEERQRMGDNPNTRSGQPSRFSTYKPSDATGSQKPWQVPNGGTKQARQPWRDAAKSKLAAA